MPNLLAANGYPGLHVVLLVGWVTRYDRVSVAVRGSESCFLPEMNRVVPFAKYAACYDAMIGAARCSWFPPFLRELAMRCGTVGKGFRYARVLSH